MRVAKSCLMSFASKACRNILELDFNEARDGQILAKGEFYGSEKGKPVKKEVVFIIDDGFIKVRTRPLDTEKRILPMELTVFEMVPGSPEEPAPDDSDELWTESMFLLETKQRAFEMTLRVLGLHSHNF